MQATDNPGELTVSWLPPPRDSHNGHLQGYHVKAVPRIGGDIGQYFLWYSIELQVKSIRIFFREKWKSSQSEYASTEVFEMSIIDKMFALQETQT